MAGNFVGGFGGLAQGFMQGMETEQKRQETAEDREYQKKARLIAEQDREEDRAYQRKTRTYADEDRARDAKQREVDNAYTAQVRAAQLAEIERKKRELTRAEDLRTADAGVLTTEDVVEPGRQTIYGNEAPVVMDDDGNMLPGAEITPEKKVTRSRQWDAIYRDYAENRRKAGDLAGALEFTDKANKFAAQRSANAFLQVQAEAGTKDVVSIAQEIGKIFDSDPMNGGTKSIEAIEGGVRMTIYNKDTGKTSTREFTGPKAREDLIAAFQPYFRPEAYAKLLEKQGEIAAEIAKNPYTSVAPGAALIDRRTGRVVAENTTGYVPALDASGQPIVDSETGEQVMVRGSAGKTGAAAGGGKGKSGTSGTSGDTPGAIKDTLKDNPTAIASATELAAAFRTNHPGMPVETANALGVRAASGVGRTMTFNPATGTFDEYFRDDPQKDDKGNVIGYGTGKTYLIQSQDYSRNGGIPPEMAAKAVAELQKTLPKPQYDSYVAARNPEARKAFVEKAEAAFKAVREKAVADVEAVLKDEKLTPQQRKDKALLIESALTSQMQNMQAEIRRMELVSEFHKDAPAGSRPGPAPAPGPSVSEMLKSGTLGAAVPKDAAEAAARAESDAAARKKAQDDARAAKLAADEQARKDIAGLTPEIIRNIGDVKTAQDMYDKYRPLLSKEQDRAFTGRLMSLRMSQGIGFNRLGRGNSFRPSTASK